MYAKNKEIHTELIEILNNIKNQGIDINVEVEGDVRIYVQGKASFLSLIKELVSEKYAICETSFVPYCYPDFTGIACDAWQEDTVSDAWCVNPTCPERILEINTGSYISEEECIRKCFNRR